jgi:hypothetical protein
MKQLCFCLLTILFVFSGCDYQGSYTFKVKNETSKLITIKFSNNPSYVYGSSENSEEVTISPQEEKIVREIYAPLNNRAHNCLQEHGISFFTELVFDTYVDGVKLEKQLWQPENWIYQCLDDWYAEYTLFITEELLNE